MLLEPGIDRSLMQLGAAEAVNDRARLRRRCCASSLTASAAPKQGLTVRSMPDGANQGIRDDVIPGVRTLQDRRRWSDRSISDAGDSVPPTGLKEVASRVWSSRRGAHLGSGRVAAASTDRTYGRKRSG